jgi:hypothetical protein
MKKIFYSFGLLVISLFILTGCDIDNNTIIYPQMPYYGYWQPYTTNANGQYVIGGYVNGQQTTRAAMTRAAIAGGKYTDFALYSWTPDSVVMDGYHGIFNGNTWGYTEAVKYFDNDVAAYSFIGVIPQNATQSFDAVNHAVTVSAVGFTTDDAAAQAGTQNGSYAEDRELLYATATVQKANYANGATLSFNHANVKVYLKFASDDSETEIIDFTPYTPGTPGQDAWDETIDVTTYQMTTTTIPTLGPLTNAIDISDEDMAYVNSKYTASKGFANYQSNNVITGNLDENMWNYLVGKYPTLSTMDLANWGTYASNSNMRLVYIDKSGHTSVDNDSYKAVWVNVQSVNWSAGTTTQTTIHHDAVPAVPATGHEGVIVLPATSAAGNGTDAVIASYPSAVDATVSLSGITMIETANSNTITFTKPDGYVYTTRVASPTTWYTFPASVNSVANVGFTVKFSYTYKGVTKYDNRVFIPAADVQWLEGKFYTYVIDIHGKGNGTTDPNDADENDPTVPQTDGITVTAVIVDYATGAEHEYTIQ